MRACASREVHERARAVARCACRAVAVSFVSVLASLPFCSAIVTSTALAQRTFGHRELDGAGAAHAGRAAWHKLLRAAASLSGSFRRSPAFRPRPSS